MFQKHRKGCTASNKWIHLNFYCREIAEADSVNTSLPGGQLKAALYTDGESNPLMAAMDAECVEEYNKNEIIGVKGPPSTTHVNQAWDNDHAGFMNVHSAEDQIYKKNTDVSNPILRLELEAAFATFHDAVPSAVMSSGF